MVQIFIKIFLLYLKKMLLYALNDYKEYTYTCYIFAHNLLNIQLHIQKRKI